MADLTADLGDGGGEFFGRRRNRVDAGRCFLGSRGRRRSALRGAVDARGDLAGHLLHAFRRPGDGADHALDVGLETIGHLPLQYLLLELGFGLVGLLRLAQAAGLEHVAAEHVDGLGHGAELVAALAAGDGHVGVAARQAVHDLGDRLKRARQAAAEQEGEHDRAQQDCGGAENEMALRAGGSCLILGRVLDDLQHPDRLTRVIPDLPDIDGGGVAVQFGITAHGPAVDHTLEIVLGGDHGLAIGRRQFLEHGAVERMHGEVDAETLLGALDELLAESCPDVDICKRLAVAHDRCHAENRERFATRFHADDGFAGLDRFHHGGAACGGVVAEHFRRMDTVERGGRSLPERDQRDSLPLDRLHGLAKQRAKPVAIALGDGVADRRQRGDHGRDRKRGAPLVIDCRRHAFILQLELLIERKLRQRALLADREAAKDGAGGRHRERDGKDEADGDRSDLEHGEAELQELLFANTQKMLNNTPLAVREITHRAGLPRL